MRTGSLPVVLVKPWLGWQGHRGHADHGTLGIIDQFHQDFALAGSDLAPFRDRPFENGLSDLSLLLLLLLRRTWGHPSRIAAT